MADLESSSQSPCEACPGPHYYGRSCSSCSSLRSFICCPEVQPWREECLRPQLPVAHRDPPAQQRPELARLPCMAGAAGTPWPSWTAAPQGPGEQGMALGRVPGQERAPERVCLSRAIWSLLFLLPTLLCLCPLLLGLLLGTQPQWEPALAAAPAGSPGQGPAIKRSIKALGSSRTLS